jgi:hypothetical protein
VHAEEEEEISVYNMSMTNCIAEDDKTTTPHFLQAITLHDLPRSLSFAPSQLARSIRGVGRPRSAYQSGTITHWGFSQAIQTSSGAPSCLEMQVSQTYVLDQ